MFLFQNFMSEVCWLTSKTPLRAVLHGSFLINRGDPYRPQNAEILTMGTPKRYPLILENKHIQHLKTPREGPEALKLQATACPSAREREGEGEGDIEMCIHTQKTCVCLMCTPLLCEPTLFSIIPI